MDENNNNHTGRKIAVGAALAAGVGYLAGILTAPKSGKETRQDIKNTANTAAAEADKKLKALQAEVEELVTEAKTKGKDLSAEAKAKLDEAVAAAKDARDKATTVVKAVKNGEAADPELNKAVKQLTQAKNNLVKYLHS